MNLLLQYISASWNPRLETLKVIVRNLIILHIKLLNHEGGTMGMPLEINSSVWKSKKENQECTSGDYWWWLALTNCSRTTMNLKIFAKVVLEGGFVSKIIKLREDLFLFDRIIVPILRHFGKLNFTYLGNLRHRSKQGHRSSWE